MPTSSRCITAFEHDVLSVGGTTGTLSVFEADALCRIAMQRSGLCRRGVASVELAQYCGVVGLGRRGLEILPKVDKIGPKAQPGPCRGVLLRMLKLAGGLPMFRHQSVGQNLRSSTLLEVFLAAFLDAVADIVRAGLMRRYREREEDLGVVRGRILVHRQATVLADRGDLVACRFDDLTADNQWNQLVKFGLHAARPWLVSDHLLRRWNGLAAAFDEVSRTSADAGLIQELTFDRQADRYRTVVQWVRWILAELSPTLRGGDNHAPGLLFDTNVLFQQAVATVLRRRLRSQSGMELRSQTSHVHLAEVEGVPPRPRIRLRPDLILESGSAPIEIADTKWKRIGMDRNGYLEPAESDVYQLLAYAAGHACERLSLIYPWHDGLAGALPTALRLPHIGAFEPRLSILCVDVHDDALGLRIGDCHSEVARVIGERTP